MSQSQLLDLALALSRTVGPSRVTLDCDDMRALMIQLVCATDSAAMVALRCILCLRR
jgi:hypothetical protein